jgi:hypothetical protein
MVATVQAVRSWRPSQLDLGVDPDARTGLPEIVDAVA